jgi:hypothetical protein
VARPAWLIHSPSPPPLPSSSAQRLCPMKFLWFLFYFHYYLVVHKGCKRSFEHINIKRLGCGRQQSTEVVEAKETTSVISLFQTCAAILCSIACFLGFSLNRCYFEEISMSVMRNISDEDRDVPSDEPTVHMYNIVYISFVMILTIYLFERNHTETSRNVPDNDRMI